MNMIARKFGSAILLMGLAGLALTAADQGTTTPFPTPPKGMALPEYDGNGKLLRPVGYEKWVVVGTSIGLGYSDGDKRDPDNPGTFHNVYLQPEAFDHYVNTGVFPEQTVFIVTNSESQPAKTKGPVSRLGFVAAPTSGLEVAIKDSKKNPDTWAYYMFHDKDDEHARPGEADRGLLTAESAFARKDCYNCHAEHGADDNVFTQFYSVLTSSREKVMNKNAAER